MLLREQYTLVFHPAYCCDLFHYVDGDDDDDDDDDDGGVYVNQSLTVILTNRGDASCVLPHRRHSETANDVASSANIK